MDKPRTFPNWLHTCKEDFTETKVLKEMLYMYCHYRIYSKLIAMIFKCYSLRKAHSTEKARFTRVYPSGIYIISDSTETMRIKGLAHGRHMLMRSRFEPSIAVSRNRYLTHMTNMFRMLKLMWWFTVIFFV